MTFKAIRAMLLARPAVASRIGSTPALDGLVDHPLWSLLTAKYPTMPQWSQVRPQLRGGICRIATMMHERNIPYHLYVEYLDKFGKGWLIRQPLSLVGYKITAKGVIPVFREFLDLIDQAVQAYKTNHQILVLQDAVYEMYPEAWGAGVLKYKYSLTLLADVLKHRTAADIMSELAKNDTVEAFWNAIGGYEAPAVVELDLSAGFSNAVVVKQLNAEQKIRTGLVVGESNPALDKFFKSGGKLNVQGLKVITGERSL